MPKCHHCDAELPIETLSAGGDLACPACGGSLDLSESDLDLSSHPGGSPADATLQLDAPSDSSLSGSSLGSSDVTGGEHSEFNETFDSSGESSEELQSADTPDVTLTYGRGDDFDKDDDLDDEDDSEHALLIEDDPEGPSESLDATLDFGSSSHEQPSAEKLEASDLAGHAAAGDLTQMFDSDSLPNEAGEMTTDSAHPQSRRAETSGDPSHPDATLASDSDQPQPGDSDTGGSSLFDSSLSASDKQSDTPSGPPEENTLAFDSERRSGNVDTPEPIDITGLSSSGTLRRGPLAEGRASASLKSGESIVVGTESVRLRGFGLGDLSTSDPAGIDYAIEGEAGKGGMGIVYKARQQSLDRLVAIKQIKSDLGASSSDRNKFVSEAVITGQLEHPNIAPVHDLGLAGDGLPFYAMKFVEGEDWEESIKKKTEEDNLAILIQVAQAIAFAHSKQIIHRDLKPGNVRLGSFGEVLVMDWGLAARLDDGSDIQPAGTPIYMPPETALEYLDYSKGKLVSGKRVSSSRRRVPAGTYCDIYLLGALLFKIVTGRAPHPGRTTFECLRSAAKNDLVKVRRSSELLDVAYKAMASEPEDRHQSALEFIEAIRSYQSHAQSVTIAKLASKDLRAAKKMVDSDQPDATKLYALFSSAQNGYQNALDLWEGNRKAERRLKKSQRMFAETAFTNGDYDLALSLLDDSSAEDEELRVAIATSQKSRNARLAWFKTLQYATAASLLVALGFIGYSFVLKQDALSLASELEVKQQQAERATELAAIKAREAEQLTELAEEQSQLAEEQTQLVTQKTREVDQLSELASEKSEEAALATKRAEQSERLADVKRQEADAATAVAQQQTAVATQQAYNAAISRVKATLAEDGTYAAWNEMQQVDPNVAAIGKDDPEWRFLARAVRWQDEATELVAANPEQPRRPTLLGSSADGEWLVTGALTSKGQLSLTIYHGIDRQPVQELTVAGGKVRQLAIDPTGQYIAIAGETLRVINRSTGQSTRGESLPERTTTVAFHPTEAELLVGTQASALERWRIDQDGLSRLQRDSQWHRTGITAVGYSRDGLQRFSTDASGRLVVWRLRDGKWLDRLTLRHEGTGSPRITVATLAEDPQGRLAYGCDDGLIYERFGWWEQPAAGDQPDGSYAQAASERLSTSHPAAVTAIAYADAGSTILSAGGEVLLVRRSPAIPRNEVAQLEALRQERRYHDATILGCAAGVDGHAYSSDESGRVVRWQIAAPPEQITLQPSRGRAGVVAVDLAEEEGDPTALVSDRAGFVRRWNDVSRPDDLATSHIGHADHRDLQAWYLEGTPARVVTVAADHRACVWRLDDGLIERTIDLGGRSIVAVDPTNRTLYAASDGRAVDGPAARQWSLDSGSSRPLWDRAARVAKLSPIAGANDRGPTLAVGLRDGQVYLWGSKSGRVELVRSSGRPHWRPITAITLDDQTGRLYTGDSGGLITAWDLEAKTAPTERLLRSEQQVGPASITRIEVADNRLLVLQKESTRLVPVLLTANLEPTPQASLADLETAALTDAVFDAGTNRFVGIFQRDNQPQLMTWTTETGWQADSNTTGGPLKGLRATAAGWLTWGGGSVSWRPRRGEDHPVAARLVSRPTTETFVENANDSVEGLTRIGSLETWSDSNQPTDARRLPVEGTLLASCPGAQPNRAILAVGENGLYRLEAWDTRRATRLGVLAELTVRPIGISLAGDLVLVRSYQQLESVTLAGVRSAPIRLPSPAGRPIMATASEGGRQIAMATSGGQAFLATRQPTGAYRINRLDREGISSVAFTPDDKRLLVGVQSGRVLMLQIGEVEAGIQTTRSLLTFPGHSDRVTLLQFAQSADGPKLVSGDASGRVVIRAL